MSAARPPRAARARRDADEASRQMLSRALEGGGYALTAQRRVIFQELCRCPDHPTAEELFLRLRRQMPELSLATVYKNLHLFGRLGLVEAVPTPDGTARFEATSRRHHHLRCVDCGALADVTDDRIEVSIPVDLGERLGFAILGVAVHLAGVCAGCAERAASTTGLPSRRSASPPPRRH